MLVRELEAMPGCVKELVERLRKPEAAASA
jgi:hypothetical protein